MSIEEKIQQLFSIYKQSKEKDGKKNVYDALIDIDYSKYDKGTFIGSLYADKEEYYRKNNKDLSLMSEVVDKWISDQQELEIQNNKIARKIRYEFASRCIDIGLRYSNIDDLVNSYFAYATLKELPKLENKMNNTTTSFRFDKHRIDANFVKGSTAFARSIDGLFSGFNIKLYFAINPEQIETFMMKYTDFCIKNQIYSYYKSRPILSNDMVTVRIDSFSDLDKVVDFIQKYKVDYKDNPFINKYRGIGISADDGGSFNSFLSNTLCFYFCNTSSASKEGYFNYLRELRKTIKKPSFDDMCGRDSMEKSAYIFFMNLDNLLEGKEFDINKFKSDFISESDRLEDERKTLFAQDSTFRSLKKLGYNYINSLYSEIVRYVLSVDGDEELIKKIVHNIISSQKVVYKNDKISFTVSELLNYFCSENAFDDSIEHYLVTNVIGMINNVKKLDRFYSQKYEDEGYDGIKGIKVDSVLINTSKKYKLDMEKVAHPFDAKRYLANMYGIDSFKPSSIRDYFEEKKTSK